MSQFDLLNIAATSIVTPSSWVSSVFVDTDKKLKVKDDAWLVSSYKYNYSTASQAPAAATRVYITGSALAIWATKLQVGSKFRWDISLTKTLAGTAASTFDICFGTAWTTADTARVSFAKPAWTAVVDEGNIVINCIIRSIGATWVAVWQFSMTHNLAATGHMVIPSANVNTISAWFDMTVASLIAWVCITSGTGDVITIQYVEAQAWNI